MNECSELSDSELLRYARQILLDDWDITAQLNLKNANIAIIGVGGLGCPVSQILARAGVGRIHLIDHDVIDESNLQRQTLFTHHDVGKYKAQIAKNVLEIANPLIHIHASTQKITDDNIADVIKKVDLVIDCTDNFGVRDVINRYCVKNGLPLLSNSAIGEIGQIALFEPDTGCYQCVFGNDLGDENNCTNTGVLASTVNVIGSMTAQIALAFLGRGHNPIKHQLLIWQGKTLTLKKLQFHKNTDCSICHYQA